MTVQSRAEAKSVEIEGWVSPHLERTSASELMTKLRRGFGRFARLFFFSTVAMSPRAESYASRKSELVLITLEKVEVSRCNHALTLETGSSAQCSRWSSGSFSVLSYLSLCFLLLGFSINSR